MLLLWSSVYVQVTFSRVESAHTGMLESAIICSSYCTSSVLVRSKVLLQQIPSAPVSVMESPFEEMTETHVVVWAKCLKLSLSFECGQVFAQH